MPKVVAEAAGGRVGVIAMPRCAALLCTWRRRATPPAAPRGIVCRGRAVFQQQEPSKMEERRVSEGSLSEARVKCWRTHLLPDSPSRT